MKGKTFTEAQALLAQPVDRGPQTLILDLIETILVYKLPTLIHKEIQTMLGLTDRDLKQTRFYQEVFAEGELKGWQKGRARGREDINSAPDTTCVSEIWAHERQTNDSNLRVFNELRL